ncbi:MAG: TetR/AcrR family transcriptional regulator [Microlunatus sp.]|nr:TetR/AcrR family transcriptional regulator [Microlunatus sp.]
MARAGLSATRLTEAGADLADRIGLGQVTLSALARQFGVQVASLYSHVHSSEDLRTRIAVLALDELADRASEALAGRSGKDALIGFANAYRDYAREHPGRYAATRLPLDPTTAAASGGRRHSELSRTILRGYQVPDAEQTHAVRLLGSVIAGYTDLERAGGFSHSDPDSGASWNRALDAVDHLLTNWPS